MQIMADDLFKFDINIGHQHFWFIRICAAHYRPTTAYDAIEPQQFWPDFVQVFVADCR